MITTNTGSQAVRLAAILFIIAFLVLLMILGEEILIPFTWAFIFSFIMLPLCEFLERKKIPRTMASLISTLLFCISGGALLFFLVYESVTILKNEGALYEKLKASYDGLISMLETQFGITLSQTTSPDSTLNNMLNWLSSHINILKEDALTLMLIPMYIFFILNYRSLLHKFAEARFSETHRGSVKKFFGKAQGSIQNYLLGTLVLTGVSTIMSFIILLAFRVHFAFFFAVFIAVLNLLPYIGHNLAIAVVLIFIWVTKESASAIIFCGIALYISNAVQENILRPKLVGDKMEMNAMMVFSAVVIGGIIWGFSGMVLFIPLLGVLHALLHSRDEWVPYTIFFKGGDEAELKQNQRE